MPIDYKRYPANWKETRERILRRATHPTLSVPACEKCGALDGQFLYSVTADLKRNGKYVKRKIWFSVVSDAMRFAGVDEYYGNEHIVKKVRVVLTIAHLDHDEENHDVTDDRLMAMCQYCHLVYDAPEKYRRSVEKWKKSGKPCHICGERGGHNSDCTYSLFDDKQFS